MHDAIAEARAALQRFAQEQTERAQSERNAPSTVEPWRPDCGVPLRARLDRIDPPRPVSSPTVEHAAAVSPLAVEQLRSDICAVRNSIAAEIAAAVATASRNDEAIVAAVGKIIGELVKRLADAEGEIAGLRARLDHKPPRAIVA